MISNSYGLIIGTLIGRYGTRIVYDAASHVDCKLNDYSVGGRWNFPNRVSLALIRVFQDLPSLKSNGTRVEWFPNSTKQFSTRSAKEVIRTHGERVSWWSSKAMFLKWQ